MNISLESTTANQLKKNKGECLIYNVWAGVEGRATSLPKLVNLYFSTQQLCRDVRTSFFSCSNTMSNEGKITCTLKELIYLYRLWTV